MSFAQFQLRRDTSTNWTTNNPTLLSGEFGLETNTLAIKLGDGSTAWTSLAYYSSKIRTGSGAPATSLGVVGDLYINTANGDLYLKTAVATYTLQSNLTGPTGATGATGPAGAVSSVTASDAGIVVGGTTSAPTIGAGLPFAGRITATSKTWASSDRNKFYERINGGAAMTDTLPTLTNTVADIGYTLNIHNKGTTTAETITFTGAGGEVIGDVATSYVLNFACRQTFVWTGTKWLFGAGNANLVKSPTVAPVAGNLMAYTDTTGRQSVDSGVVPSTITLNTRNINTTAPLTGGGNLTADRTLAISAATTTTAGSQSAADKYKQNNSRIDIVAEYGADPTGVTAIDTAVANAMAALPSTGGRIFFPTGTYKLNGTITVAKPIVFCGQNQSISVISMTHATQDVFSLTTGAQGAAFEDLRIIGATTGTRTGGYGINLGTQANTIIRRVDMLYMWSGVHSSGALQDIDGMNILNGGANAANGQAILVDSTGDRYIRRVVTNQGSSPTGYSAIRIRECSSCVIEACNLINSGNVIDIVPNAGGGHAVASVYAVDCFFDTSVIGVNIVPASSSDTAQRMTFIRCWCSTMSTAGAVIGDGVVPNANINSLRFIGCEFYQAPVGIDAKGAGDWNVTDSEIAGNSTAGIRASVGVGGGHSFSVMNNFIGSGGGFGANGIGITIGAGSYGHYQITGNRGLDTNTTIGITDAGTVTDINDKYVQNNPGAGLLTGTVALITSNVALTANTVEQVILSASIPANTLTVGTTLRFAIYMSATQTAAAVTSTFRIRIGPTTLTGAVVANTGALSAATARTTNTYQVQGGATIRAAGSTGSALGGVEADGNYYAQRNVATVVVITTPPTVNTTVANLIEITQQNSAATMTAVTAEYGFIEVVRG